MKTTETDAHLARIYYDVLLDHAHLSPGAPIRYKELLDRAKRAHPLDDTVQSAIPVSMGRRLDVIARFVRTHGLPPLTCLAVNDQQYPGAGYTAAHGSWEKDMEAVAVNDWSGWKGQWHEHIEAISRAAVPRKRRKEDAARLLMHQAYVDGTVPKMDPGPREQLVALLMDGMGVDEAMAELAEGSSSEREKDR